MFKTFTYALVLVSMCLSMVPGAEAGPKSLGGSKSVMTMDLGSGR